MKAMIQDIEVCLNEIDCRQNHIYILVHHVFDMRMF